MDGTSEYQSYNNNGSGTRPNDYARSGTSTAHRVPCYVEQTLCCCQRRAILSEWSVPSCFLGVSQSATAVERGVMGGVGWLCAAFLGEEILQLLEDWLRPCNLSVTRRDGPRLEMMMTNGEGLLCALCGRVRYTVFWADWSKNRRRGAILVEQALMQCAQWSCLLCAILVGLGWRYPGVSCWRSRRTRRSRSSARQATNLCIPECFCVPYFSSIILIQLSHACDLLTSSFISR